MSTGCPEARPPGCLCTDAGLHMVAARPLRGPVRRPLGRVDALISRADLLVQSGYDGRGARVGHRRRAAAVRGRRLPAAPTGSPPVVRSCAPPAMANSTRRRRRTSRPSSACSAACCCPRTRSPTSSRSSSPATSTARSTRPSSTRSSTSTAAASPPTRSPSPPRWPTPATSAAIGGAPYLHTLIASVPTAANASYYARIVGERAVLRRLVEAGTRIVQLGYGSGRRRRPRRRRRRRPRPAGRLRRHRAPGQRGLRGAGRHAPADPRRDRGGRRRRAA